MPHSPTVKESVSPIVWIISFLVGMLILILFLGPPWSSNFESPSAPMEVIEKLHLEVIEKLHLGEQELGRTTGVNTDQFPASRRSMPPER